MHIDIVGKHIHIFHSPQTREIAFISTFHFTVFLKMS